MKRTKNRYMELKRRQQEEFNALPLGFAFSQKQFNEMMENWDLDPGKDTDKIYHVGAGGYIQKKDAELLHRTRERHDAGTARRGTGSRHCGGRNRGWIHPRHVPPGAWGP